MATIGKFLSTIVGNLIVFIDIHRLAGSGVESTIVEIGSVLISSGEVCEKVSIFVL